MGFATSPQSPEKASADRLRTNPHQRSEKLSEIRRMTLRVPSANRHKNKQAPFGVDRFPALLTGQPKLELNEEHPNADRKDPASVECVKPSRSPP